MDTTPVRIRHQDKVRLERLQEEITAATGKRPSQQEIVGNAVDFTLRHRDEFLAETAWRPFSPPEIDQMLKRLRSTKGWKAVPVDEIDHVVYDEE